MRRLLSCAPTRGAPTRALARLLDRLVLNELLNLLVELIGGDQIGLVGGVQLLPLIKIAVVSPGRRSNRVELRNAVAQL